MLRAVDYLRVSTADQAKGYGISYSGKETASYILRKGWEHVGTFADEGVSGALESHQRPQLRVLVAAARAVPRTFDIVVVNEGRVIGRTGRAFWRWVWELQDVGIFVAVVKRDYDNSTPDGESKMRKDADYAEDERDNIRERTQGGIQEKAEEGGYVGGNVPYGYRVEGQGRTGESHLVLDECGAGQVCEPKHEACILRRGRALYVALRDWGQVAAVLNAEGCARRDGRPWGGQHLRRQVLKPGLLEARQTFRGSREVKRDHEGHPVNGDAVDIPLPPVYTLAEVEELRALCGQPARTLRKSCVYTLSGRIVSPCGKRYIGGGTIRGAKAYRCQGRSQAYGGQPSCSCPYLEAEPVEEHTWRQVRMLLGDAETLAAVAGSWVGAAADLCDGARVRLAELDREIGLQRRAVDVALGAGARDLVVRDLSPEASRAAAERLIASLRAELAVLRDARRVLKASMARRGVVQDRSALLVDVATMARRELGRFPLERQAEFTAALEVMVALLVPHQRRYRGQSCGLSEWFADRNLSVPLLTDEGWAAIEPMMTHRPRMVSPRAVMTGILYKARTSTSWTELPPLFGCAATLRTYSARWRESGFWENAMQALANAESTPLPGRPTLSMRIECSVRPQQLLMLGDVDGPDLRGDSDAFCVEIGGSPSTTPKALMREAIELVTP
ncbi:recombinase family protein [Streptomyces sp. NPDC050256]|uniref:recombinase family protein n=1 Tax=Streptomyces sp. NPDC050256 TaxID=3365607 RepID=UPI0037B46E41